MPVSSRNFKIALTGSLALTLAAACLFLPKHVLVAGDMAAVGSPAPNFTLPNQENKPVSLSDYKGKWVVLYFYPKDQTSGWLLAGPHFQGGLLKYSAVDNA